MIDGVKWINADHVIIGNDIFLATNQFLAKTEIGKWDTHYILNIQNIEWLRQYGVGYMVAIKDIIYLISWKSFSIAKYDIGKNAIEMIFNEEGTTSIFYPEKWKDYLFVFRRLKPEVLIIDNTGHLRIKQLEIDDNLQNMKICRLEDKVLFLPLQGKSCYQFDFADWKIHSVDLPFSLEHCISAREYNEKVYLLDNQRIIIWDQKTGFKEMDIRECEINSSLYYMIVPLESHIFLLPNRGVQILIIQQDGMTHFYDGYPKDYTYTPSEEWLKIGTKYLCYEKKEGVYYFPRRSTNYMLTLDSRSETIKWISVQEPSVQETMNYELSDHGITKERNTSFKKYLECI